MPPNDPEFAALAGAAVRLVAGWAGAARTVPPGLRTDLMRLVPHILVDRPDRETYLGHLREARRTSGRVGELEAAAERTDLSTDEVIRSGVGALSDEYLAVLAVEPIWLNSLAELIDELSLVDGLGPVWWDAMGRAGARSESKAGRPPIADSALLGRYRAVAALPRDDLFATAAEVLRAAAPSDLLAGGTAEEFVRQWAAGRFAALCLGAAADPTLLADLVRPDADTAELAVRVAAFLRPREGFAAVGAGPLAALAVAVTEAVRNSD